MAKQLKLRRGSTSQHSSFTGAEGEVTVDTDKESLVVHNGSTAGGFAIARADSPDNQKTRWGTGNDLEIFSDGSTSFLRADDLRIRSLNNENYTTYAANGAATLFFDNSAKFATTSGGATLTGDLTITDDLFVQDNIFLSDTDCLRFGDSEDLEIQHNGSNNVINYKTGNLIIKQGTRADAESAQFDGNGNLAIPDNRQVYFGGSGDLALYHDGSHSYIKDAGTGKLRILSNEVVLGNEADDETLATFIADGACNLYFDNSKKLETTSWGAKVTGNLVSVGHTKAHLNNTYDLGDASTRWRDLYMGRDIYIPDNGVLRIGNATYGDLKLYHDGSNSYITDAGTGALRIQTNEFAVYNAGGSEWLFKAAADGASSLKYDGTTKVETLSGGAKVTGTLEATNTTNISSGNLQIGGTNVINSGRSLYNVESIKLSDSKELILGSGDDLKIYHASGEDQIRGTGNKFEIRSNNLQLQSTGGEKYIVCTADASIELYYNGNKKFETHSGGINVTGSVNPTGNVALVDNSELKLGNGDDLKLWHSGSHNYIKGATSGQNLYIQNTNGSINIQAKLNESSIWCGADGDVELYFDNSKKFETSSTGAEVFGRFSVGSTGQLVNESAITATSGGNTACFRATNAAGHSPLMTWNNHTSGNRSQIQFADGSSFTARGSITTNGSNVTYGGTSDYRLKQDDVLITDGITKVKALKPKRFKWKDNLSIGICDGFFAHEVQETAPTSGATIGTKDEVDSDGNPVYQSVDQAKLVPLLTAALKESITKIETLETKVAALEAG